MNHAWYFGNVPIVSTSDDADVLQFFARLASIPSLVDISGGEALVLAEDFARLFPKATGGKTARRGKSWNLLNDLHRRLLDLVRCSETGETFRLDQLLDLETPAGVVDPESRELDLSYPSDPGPLATFRRIVRIGRRVPLRRCAREGCGIVFVPQRLTSKYHSPECLYRARLDDEGRKKQKRDAVRRARDRVKKATRQRRN